MHRKNTCVGAVSSLADCLKLWKTGSPFSFPFSYLQLNRVPAGFLISCNLVHRASTPAPLWLACTQLTYEQNSLAVLLFILLFYFLQNRFNTKFNSELIVLRHNFV